MYDNASIVKSFDTEALKCYRAELRQRKQLLALELRQTKRTYSNRMRELSLLKGETRLRLLNLERFARQFDICKIEEEIDSVQSLIVSINTELLKRRGD